VDLEVAERDRAGAGPGDMAFLIVEQARGRPRGVLRHLGQERARGRHERLFRAHRRGLDLMDGGPANLGLGELVVCVCELDVLVDGRAGPGRGWRHWAVGHDRAAAQRRGRAEAQGGSGGGHRGGDMVR
jgi:hypothetical protein